MTQHLHSMLIITYKLCFLFLVQIFSLLSLRYLGHHCTVQYVLDCSRVGQMSPSHVLTRRGAVVHEEYVHTCEFVLSN